MERGRYRVGRTREELWTRETELSTTKGTSIYTTRHGNMAATWQDNGPIFKLNFQKRKF